MSTPVDSTISKYRWAIATGIALVVGFNFFGYEVQQHENDTLCIAAQQRSKVDKAYHERLNRDFTKLHVTQENAATVQDMAQAESERAAASPILAQVFACRKALKN